MKNVEHSNKLEDKKIYRVALITALILMVPFLLMQFNVQIADPGNPGLETVNWNVFDFVVMGFLIFATGIAYEILILKMNTRAQRWAVAILVAGAFFLIWAELAVGIFGSPIAGS